MTFFKIKPLLGGTQDVQNRTLREFSWITRKSHSAYLFSGKITREIVFRGKGSGKSHSGNLILYIYFRENGFRKMSIRENGFGKIFGNEPIDFSFYVSFFKLKNEAPKKKKS